MILIFDLDDTLYEERTYVESGFKAVAQFLQSKFQLNYEDCFSDLVDLLENQGRGRIFDDFLAGNNLYSKRMLNKCLAIYRGHAPKISLNKNAKIFLDKHRDSPLYLVTDGNRNVQEKKIEALRIKKYFKRIFITHRYGIKNAKPSIYCFNLIRELEKVSWQNMVYVGDNPTKDFVNLNSLGVLTVRVLTGEHRLVSAKKNYDAQHTINSIAELDVLLRDVR